MAKNDYTKTENLLNEALLKMTVQELLALADKAGASEKEKDSLPSLQARTILLTIMHHDLETLSKVKGADIKNVGMTAKEIQDIIEHVKEVSAEEWEELKKVRDRVLKYKTDLWDKIPHLTNDQIIELERKKHINKRFNTRDKWLPLH